MSDKHYVHQPDETELARILRQSRGWFETYGTTLIYGISAVLAVTALVVYLQRRPPATAPASNSLLLASSIEDYQDLADQFPDTEIGARARLRQADLQTNSAIGKMFTDRAAAIEELEAARKAYERLVDRTDLAADIRERVLAGIARVTESQNDGSVESINRAVTAWQKLLDEFPASKVFKAVAEERIASLKKPSASSFYAWFNEQDPKPGDDLLLPQDQPKVPDIPNAFELPSFGIPENTSEAPATDAAALEKPTATSGEIKPADALPKTDADPASTPTEEGKPSEPASEAPSADAPADGSAASTPATEEKKGE